MKTIKIEDAHVADLEAFARITLGADTSGATTKAKLRALIAAVGYKEPTIEIDDTLPIPAVMAKAGPAIDVPGEDGEDGLENQGPVDVFIPIEKGPGGDQHIPVTVNGRCMAVPRGERITLPYAYFMALQTAVGIEYEITEIGGLGRAYEVPAYSMQVLR